MKKRKNDYNTLYEQNPLYVNKLAFPLYKLSLKIKSQKL